MIEKISNIEEINDQIPIRRVMISVADTTALDVLISGLLEYCPGVVIYAAQKNYHYVKELVYGKRIKQDDSLSRSFGRQLDIAKQVIAAPGYEVFFGSTRAGILQVEEESRVADIDLVVINLQPIDSLDLPRDYKSVSERIDAYSPFALRVSIANSHRVMTLSQPDDYAGFVKEVKESAGLVSFESRLKMIKMATLYLQDCSTALFRAVGKINSLDAKACLTLDHR